MNYILIAAAAYFLVAIEVILDKFLISSKKISHPSIYTFYVGMMSIFAVAFFPLGFHWLNFWHVFYSILSGIIFIYGLLALFYAIEKSEASRVMPVVGAIIPIVTFLLSLFFLEERLRTIQFFGVAALIAGGIFISFEFPLKNKRKFFQGFRLSIVAGILLAMAFTWFKYFYDRDNFANVFIWTRLGLFLGAASLFLHTEWRKKIWLSFAGFRRPQKTHYKTGFLFVVNKILGGIGSIMTHYAISLGSVTIVNALVSIEYVFILIIGFAISFRFPRIFQEKNDVLNVTQKAVSICIIALGLILISVKFKQIWELLEKF